MAPRRPKRWNPMPVTIRQLQDKSVGDTLLDEDFDEVVGGVLTPVIGSDLELQAQVVYKKHDKWEPSLGGNVDIGDGHLCFTLEYLESVGLSPLTGGNTISVGDRIVNMAGIATDYRIIEVRPAGHIRSIDQKPMLYLAYFEFPKESHARVV